MRAIKLVITIKHFKYKERLQKLKLTTLRFRRIRGEMIEVHKILTCTYCKNVKLHLELYQDKYKRAQPEAGQLDMLYYVLRKFSVLVRILNI